MAIGEKSDQQPFNHLLLTNNYLVHFHVEHVNEGTLLLYTVIECFDISFHHFLSIFYVNAKIKDDVLTLGLDTVK